MKTTPDITPAQLKVIHKLEEIALELDQGCRSGQIETEKIDAAQQYISKVFSKLPVSESPEEWVYILHESQALLHWIRGDESEAYRLIRSAHKIKGDGSLFTDTARKLLDKENPQPTSNKKGSRRLTTKELFLVALASYLVSILDDGVVGTYLGVVGFLFLLFAIASAIQGSTKK